MPDPKRDDYDRTKAKRAQVFRNKTRAAGLVEVRGVYVPAEMTEAAKAVIRQMVEDWKKNSPGGPKSP